VILFSSRRFFSRAPSSSPSHNVLFPKPLWLLGSLPQLTPPFPNFFLFYPLFPSTQAPQALPSDFLPLKAKNFPSESLPKTPSFFHAFPDRTVWRKFFLLSLVFLALRVPFLLRLPPTIALSPSDSVNHPLYSAPPHFFVKSLP